MYYGSREVRTYESEKNDRDNTGNMSFIHHDTDGSGGRSRIDGSHGGI